MPETGTAVRPATVRFGAAAFLAIVAAMLVGDALRLYGLTRHDLWLDEANSVAIARQPFAAIPKALALDSSPPLYYWLLHFWMMALGESEAAVRLPAVVLGVLLIPATALLARRLAGEPAAVTAAWLVAATPIAVQFSQQARMYMLLPLLAAIAAERLLAYIETGSRGALVAHALALLACFYTHNWGLLLLPGAAAAMALAPRGRLAGWAAAAGAAVALYLPWVPALREQIHGHSYRFIDLTQAATDSWSLPFRSLVLFASGVGNPGEAAHALLPGILSFLAAGVWAIVIAAALIFRPAWRRRALAILAMVIVPPLVGLSWLFVGKPIYFLGRYEIEVLPMLIALLSGGAALLVPRRWLAPVVAGWVLMLAVLAFDYNSAVRRTYPEPAMARTLAPALLPGDRVVFTALFRATSEYYLRRAGASYEGVSYPPDVAAHPGWYDDDMYDLSDPALQAAALRLCPSPGGRTWVVGSNAHTSLMLLRILGKCSHMTTPFAEMGRPMTNLFLAVPD